MVYFKQFYISRTKSVAMLTNSVALLDMTQLQNISSTTTTTKTSDPVELHCKTLQLDTNKYKVLHFVKFKIYILSR